MGGGGMAGGLGGNMSTSSGTVTQATCVTTHLPDCDAKDIAICIIGYITFCAHMDISAPSSTGSIPASRKAYDESVIMVMVLLVLVSLCFISFIAIAIGVIGVTSVLVTGDP